MKMKCVSLIGERNDLIPIVANLYCQIFAEPPWDEDLSIKETIATMKEQFQLPSAVALAACTEENEVVGFSWLYEIFPGDLQEGTRYSPELKHLFDGGRRVFYFQEIGVRKEFRQQRVGERIAREILERVKKIGGDIVVLSTNYQAIPATNLFSKIGFKNSGIVRPPKELGRTYWILKL